MLLPRKLQTHPRLSMKALRAEQCFDVAAEFTFSFQNHAVGIMFFADTGKLRIETIIREQAFVEQVEITSCKLKFGWRRYFVCPRTRRACDELHFTGTRWVSRQSAREIIGSKNGSLSERHFERINAAAERLKGTVYRGPARGKTRERLAEIILKEFPRVDPAHKIGETLAEVWRKKEAQVKSSGRSNSRTGELSTASAILKGDRLPLASDIRQWIRSDNRIDHVAYPPPPLLPANRAIGILEHHAKLDMRTLALIVPKCPGRGGANLQWPDEIMEGAQIELIIEMNLAAGAKVVVRRRSPSGLMSIYSLQLVRAKSHPRLLLRCPYRGTDHDVLFLRDGVFASAKAHRLVHASQRRQAD
ncbi:hypothetical protein [Sphingomonas sp. RB1R13]|uniref:hypothetical protein n=1 Tax=Sphingomonas sp. RB1R13 TaxID=3096159 RepID=UPI002FC8D307